MSDRKWYRNVAGQEIEFRPTQAEAFSVADDAIGLFLEYRDQHGYSEEDARRSAAVETAEGAALTDADIGLHDVGD
jgi:hypothetical protein